MKVHAAVLISSNQPFSIEEVELAGPKLGEVLVKMEAVGICHSDYHVLTGDTQHPLPAILGHEGFGTVIESKSNYSQLSVGQKVSLSWAPSCHQCYYCKTNRPALCQTFKKSIWNGTLLDGTTRFSSANGPIYHYCGLGCFAEYITVSEMACIPMPSTLRPEIGALIGCAVTTGVGSVLTTANVQPESIVVVIGCGGVGLSTILAAKYAKAKTIIAIDQSQTRLNAALDCGADHATSLESAKAIIKQVSDNRGADYLFEAVGNPSLQVEAIAITRPGGKVIFSGLSPMDASITINGALITREEKTILGSYYGSANPEIDFSKYANLYLAGTLPLDKLITHTYSLSGINIAFKDMLEGVSRRGVVIF